MSMRMALVLTIMTFSSITIFLRNPSMRNPNYFYVMVFKRRMILGPERETLYRRSHQTVNIFPFLKNMRNMFNYIIFLNYLVFSILGVDLYLLPFSVSLAMDCCLGAPNLLSFIASHMALLVI